MQTNDFVRDKLTDKSSGKIPFYAEMIAGGCAGGSQVYFVCRNLIDSYVVFNVFWTFPWHLGSIY